VRRVARAWLRRRALLPRRVRIALAVAMLAGAVGSTVAQGSPPPQSQRPTKLPSGPPAPPPNPRLVAHGRTLYVESCSSCHGLNANGVPGSGPSLRGVGAGPTDFYLSTGRMPLQNPHDQPERGRPHFPRPEIDALIAYVASLGGPAAPGANPARGSLSEGFELFTENCAGCHQGVARGGIATGARVPDLQHADVREIAEAVRMGPYVMPRFSEKQIDQHELDSLARYIVYTRNPNDAGGWGIGHIGPVPEGMVAWLMAGAALVLVCRLIGERTVS
jgi:ubiquinol-cytochrome c reductase cytochrome c subunit